MGDAGASFLRDPSARQGGHAGRVYKWDGGEEVNPLALVEAGYHLWEELLIIEEAAVANGEF